MNLLYNHLSVNQDGHLAIGGLDTLELAKTYGLTPNAVSLRLYKTREKLRLHLEEGGYTV